MLETLKAAGPAMPSIMEEAFARAFGDLPLETVLALREGTAWRYFSGGGVPRYADLLSIAVLDAYLRTDGARSPRIAMADDSREGSAGVPEHEFTLPDGRVDLPRLLRRFDAGASLVASQFHETHPPLGRFCRGLEKLFLHGCQTNIYLTPPQAQGFRTHFDTHDVLVLQVSGRKRWRIWDGQAVENPTRRTPWPGHMAPEGEPNLVMMEPGDALYIPRGVMHDAATEPGEPSLHITVGLLEPSWAQALRSLIDSEEVANTPLRQAVPTWRLAEPEALAGLLEAMAEKLRGLATAGHAERLSLLLLDQLAHDRQPLPARGLFLDELTEDVPMRLADGMHHHLAIAPDGQASLHWTCGEIILAAHEAAWLEPLTDGATAAELGEGALEFMQRLRREGLLEAAV